MDEKIKKIAIKTEGLIKYFGTPQMTFDNLKEISKKQKEYFEYLGPDNFIKLSIYNENANSDKLKQILIQT